MRVDIKQIRASGWFTHEASDKTAGGFGLKFWGFTVSEVSGNAFQHWIFHFATQTNRPIIQWRTSSQQSKTVWLNSCCNSLCNTNLHGNIAKHTLEICKLNRIKGELNPTCFIFCDVDLFSFSFLNPLSASPPKLLNTQTIRRQFVNKLFECVSPFSDTGA